jgi:hypothetical protein
VRGRTARLELASRADMEVFRYTGCSDGTINGPKVFQGMMVRSVTAVGILSTPMGR